MQYVRLLYDMQQRYYILEMSAIHLVKSVQNKSNNAHEIKHCADKNNTVFQCYGNVGKLRENIWPKHQLENIRIGIKTWCIQGIYKEMEARRLE